MLFSELDPLQSKVTEVWPLMVQCISSAASAPSEESAAQRAPQSAQPIRVVQRESVASGRACVSRGAMRTKASGVAGTPPPCAGGTSATDSGPTATEAQAPPA